MIGNTKPLQFSRSSFSPFGSRLQMRIDFRLLKLRSMDGRHCVFIVLWTEHAGCPPFSLSLDRPGYGSTRRAEGGLRESLPARQTNRGNAAGFRKAAQSGLTGCNTTQVLYSVVDKQPT